MKLTLTLRIRFDQAIRLSAIAEHRKLLKATGVYVLTEGKPADTVFDPLGADVVYIGKANRHLIYDRCFRHVRSVLGSVSAKSGKPTSAPGEWFKAYRETIGRDPSRLWVTPGFMAAGEPYLISCAEEYLLHKYSELHGRYPLCNSAGQKRHAVPGTSPGE